MPRGRRRAAEDDEASGKPNPIDIHVGGRVRLRRTLLGMSQEKLGEAIGLTFQQVQKYERGANRIGSSRLFDLARVLDVPVSYFFEDMSADTAARTPSRIKGLGEVKTAPIEPDPMVKRETLELVRAYYRIGDPAIRKRLFELTKSLAEARHTGAEPGLGPDAKSQVTLLYEDGRPIKATSIVVSTQHAEKLSQDEVREIVRPHVVNTLPAGWMCPEEEFYVNPTGRFVIGGPDGDTGLTGRKIIVDTYGGASPHGGGAFSGKDPTKVDRSAAYACRYLAKNVVAAGLADRCTIQVSYAIGVSKPLSVYVETHGTGRVPEEKLSSALQQLVDLSPRGIREHLQLNRPIYARTAAYGHFGRAPEPDGGFSWEKLDLVERLLRAV